MGYEIKYFYKEETEVKGQYSEEIKEKKVKIGDPWEEVPLEVVAGKIMAQLAKRNIFVTDVEIYRLAKEQISYRNTEDGIVIKNKKFRYDDGPAMTADETEIETIISGPTIPTHKPVVNKVIDAPVEARVNLAPRILRYEMYDAQHPALAAKGRRAGKFTLNKKYPVFQEITKGIPPTSTTMYITKDDTGKEVEVHAECFTAVSNPKLNFEGLIGEQDDGGDIPLSFGNVINDNMIDLRRR